MLEDVINVFHFYVYSYILLSLKFLHLTSVLKNLGEIWSHVTLTGKVLNYMASVWL